MKIERGREDIGPMVQQLGDSLRADRAERRQMEASGQPLPVAEPDSIACIQRGLWPLRHDPLQRTRVELETLGSLPEGISTLKVWGYTRQHAEQRMRRAWAGALIDKAKLARDAARQRAIEARIYVAEA